MPRYDVLVCYPLWQSRIATVEAPDPARAAQWAMDDSSLATDWKSADCGETHVESIFTVNETGDPDRSFPVPPCFQESMESEIADGLRFVLASLEAISPSLEAVKVGKAILADYHEHLRREPVVSPGSAP